VRPNALISQPDGATAPVDLALLSRRRLGDLASFGSQGAYKAFQGLIAALIAPQLRLPEQNRGIVVDLRCPGFDRIFEARQNRPGGRLP
jgi:hypothetical protein